MVETSLVRMRRERKETPAPPQELFDTYLRTNLEMPQLLFGYAIGPRLIEKALEQPDGLNTLLHNQLSDSQLDGVIERMLKAHKAYGVNNPSFFQHKDQLKERIIRLYRSAIEIAFGRVDRFLRNQGESHRVNVHVVYDSFLQATSKLVEKDGMNVGDAIAHLLNEDKYKVISNDLRSSVRAINWALGTKEAKEIAKRYRKAEGNEDGVDVENQEKNFTTFVSVRAVNKLVQDHGMTEKEARDCVRSLFS